MQFDEANSEARLLEEIGSRLREHRLRRDLTQAQLAREAGVSQRTIRNMESGAGTQLESLLRVLRVLGLLPGLSELLPAPGPSPIELLEREGTPRQRASGSRSREDQAPWTWGDEE